MSEDEIPAYDDPHPDPAAERINAECQARIDRYYDGKAVAYNPFRDLWSQAPFLRDYSMTIQAQWRCHIWRKLEVVK